MAPRHSSCPFSRSLVEHPRRSTYALRAYVRASSLSRGRRPAPPSSTGSGVVVHPAAPRPLDAPRPRASNSTTSGQSHPASNLPQHLRSLPQHLRSLPRHLGSPPQHLGSLPQHLGSLPQHLGSLPQHLEASRSIFGKPPAASGKPPAASAKPPAASGKPPAASGKPPAASGKPPAASGKPPAASWKSPAASGEVSRSIWEASRSIWEVSRSIWEVFRSIWEVSRSTHHGLRGILPRPTGVLHLDARPKQLSCQYLFSMRREKWLPGGSLPMTTARSGAAANWVDASRAAPVAMKKETRRTI